jgi:hypothetical protein
MTEPASKPRKRKPRAKAGEGKPQPNTAYVILRRVVPRGGADLHDLYDLDELDPLRTPEELLADLEAGLWLPVGESEARTEKRAIELVVRDQVAGDYKAVAARSWKGGERLYEQTKLVSKPLDE